MQDRLVRFHLFGQEFTFYSDAPKEEVDSVIALLRQELESDTSLSQTSVPSSKRLVLGCLRMTAKYVQLNQEYKAFRQTHEQMISQMIEKVVAHLD
jgi:hypothetical protein